MNSDNDKSVKSEKPEKPRLGRGLSALLGENNMAGHTAPLSTLPIERIEANKDQPRRTFREEELDELAQSIKNQGLLQPIVVRERPDKKGYYQIIAGERRWRAAMKARLHALPVVIKEVADNETLVLSLVENIQRDDLTPIEEARAYNKLMIMKQLTQADVAGLVGKSRPVIANALRLLSLPDSLQQLVDSGQLSSGHGRSLVGLEDPEMLAQTILAEGWSVRETEDFVKKLQETNERDLRKKAEGSDKSHYENADKLELEQQLSVLLDCQVSVETKGKKPVLRCRFSSSEDLQQFIRRMKQLL